MTGWDRSDDPIPEGHIRRSEAFEAYYRKVTPHWEALEKAIEDAHARRAGAENAPKISAWKQHEPLSKTEGEFFQKVVDSVAQLSTQAINRVNELSSRVSQMEHSEIENAFWKAEKTFYEAAKAKNDARDDAARKFIAALAAGELQPMIRKHGSNQVLSPNIWDRDILWDKDDVVPLLAGLDGIIGCGRRTRPVFFNAGEFQDWLANQGTAAATAAPKVGPDGGRSSSMYAIEAELDRWIAGKTKLILEQMRQWAPLKHDTRSKGRLALALSGWSEKAGGATAKSTIEKALPEKLNKALALIK